MSREGGGSIFVFARGPPGRSSRLVDFTCTLQTSDGVKSEEPSFFVRWNGGNHIRFRCNSIEINFSQMQNDVDKDEPLA